MDPFKECSDLRYNSLFKGYWASLGKRQDLKQKPKGPPFRTLYSGRTVGVSEGLEGVTRPKCRSQGIEEFGLEVFRIWATLNPKTPRKPHKPATPKLP